MSASSFCRFCIFTQPVDIDSVPDYLEIISEPMDLETMMTKIDRHEYICAQDFLKNIDMICANALEYNPNHSAEDQHIRHTACALRDTAYTLIKTEMDSDFEDKCRSIRTSRHKRKTTVTDLLIPDFVYTQPLPSNTIAASNNASNGGTSSSSNKSSISATPTSNGKKRKKRSLWSRGFLAKPKKKPHLDKSLDSKKDENEEVDETIEDDSKGEEEEEMDESVRDESVRDVDPTSTVDTTVG